LHSTIADNTSGDGCAVGLTSIPARQPTDPTLYTADVVSATPSFPARRWLLRYCRQPFICRWVLWHSTPTHFQAGGAHLTVVNERTGEPRFPAGWLFICGQTQSGPGLGSVSRGAGMSMVSLRDWGDKKDLGADEYVPTV
jgi:hypothetical protein